MRIGNGVLKDTISCLNQPQRKQRGITLVPVIVSLTIGIVTTVVFIKQGAEVANGNRINMAINEISELVNDWNLLRDYSSRQEASSIYSSSMPTTNVFNQTVTFEYVNQMAIIIYETINDENCKALEPIFTQGTLLLSSNAICVPTPAGLKLWLK